MRRTLISDEDTAAFGGLSFCLSFHQSGDACGEQRDIPFLPGHDIGQVLDGAGQMGNLFLKACDGFHAPQIGRLACEIKP
jgi:hypothetical protein